MPDLDPDPLRELSDALLGQVLPGSEGRRYPLRERIGEGGQGWVFRATWNGSVDVVVKVLRPDAASADALARFQREADVLRTLSQQASPNPHLVRFFDHAYARVHVAATGKIWELPFTVLELVDGETLERALERAHPWGIGLERSRRILRHVVLALKDVHARNIVHRDLKPSNILLSTPGGREIAKVTDFGLAKLLDPGMQRTTTLAGATVGYAPPEQFENGNLRVGPQTDVFSLAAMFYELVTGVPAFPYHPNAHPLMVIVRILHEARPAFARVPAKLPRELAERPDVVAAVDAELSRALSPEPGDRHPTVTDLFEGLERALAALSGTPSLPASRAGGGVLVRPGGPPSDDSALALARTVHSETPSDRPISSTAPMSPLVRVPGRNVAEASALGWRCITGPLGADAFRRIAVAPAGGRAVGLGPRGPAQWQRGQWTSLELPADLPPRAMRVAAWLDDRLLIAGASSLVASIEGDKAPTTWRFEAQGLVFYGLFADRKGVVLAGKRGTSSGPLGVIAEIPFGSSGGPAWRGIDVPGCDTLRAATRLDSGVLACGDGGAIAVTRGVEPPRVVRVCEPPLLALLPMPDGTTVAVGGGGHAYSVWPTLDVKLDAVQTTRDLLALARAPDGTLWCAGAAGRVLRRDSQGWVRVGVEGVEGRIRGLHASGHRVLAFCDDGSVFEGVAL